MTSLGIYCLGADPSAAIIKNGQAIAFVEEERILRYKHATDLFPLQAIEQVFKQTGLTWDDIDNICFPWECAKYDNSLMREHYDAINIKYNIHDPRDIAYEHSHLNFHKSENISGIILQHLRKQYGDIKFPPIQFVNHHLSHACTAFFTSGLQQALVLSIDGSGEDVTTSIWKGDGTTVTLLKEVKTPISLGWFYSAFTEYIGFHAYGDEWQVMGMASYGHRSDDFYAAKKKFGKVIYYDGHGGIDGDPHLNALGTKSFSRYCSDTFVALMGKPPRTAAEPVEQWHKDYALAAQLHLEEIVQELVHYWVKQTGINNLCVAGGVAMNVKMNGNLFEKVWLNSVYVYPVASDAGTSIGAGMAHYYESKGGLKNTILSNVYLGNVYDDSEIEEVLKKCNLSYSVPENLETFAAEKIGSGKIVGWFQTGMEAGQRALGARSILADPRSTKSRDIVNAVIKYRQPWRPFCPSMLEEEVQKYFVAEQKVAANLKYPVFDFMTLTLTANQKAKEDIPAVVHIDGTSRIQVVKPQANTRYYNLLKAFQKLTGIGVLLNTSFNIKGEPIVCTPADAVRTFYGTGLDVLVIGNCVLEK